MNTEIKDRLKEIRKSLHLNQTDFAKQLGIIQRTYSSYESGSRPVPDHLIKSICAIYDVPEDWLASGTGNRVPESPTVNDQIAVEIAFVLKPDADETEKELVRDCLMLIHSIPRAYYPDIADFLHKLIERQKSEQQKKRD